MPTYDYECTKCGHRFEYFQKITAAPIRKCPVCAGRVRRLIGSGAGIIFKGTGFYQTDYKNKQKEPKACPAADTKPECKSCPAAKPTKDT